MEDKKEFEEEFVTKETPPEPTKYDSKYLCKTVGDFQFREGLPKNRKHLFTLDEDLPCQNHAENTCCMTADIRKIFMRLNHYDISPKCKKMTENIQCSVCDGDIGIQKKTGICPDICDNWYQMC